MQPILHLATAQPHPATSQLVYQTLPQQQQSIRQPAQTTLQAPVPVILYPVGSYFVPAYTQTSQNKSSENSEHKILPLGGKVCQSQTGWQAVVQ